MQNAKDMVQGLKWSRGEARHDFLFRCSWREVMPVKSGQCRQLPIVQTLQQSVSLWQFV